jgi:hypothetical protein
LHLPNGSTLRGTRGYAQLFLHLKMAARLSRIAGAYAGHPDRADDEYYILLRQKGGGRPPKMPRGSARAKPGPSGPHRYSGEPRRPSPEPFLL